MKVFVTRYPEKGELPSISKKYFTSHGHLYYSVIRNEFSDEDWLLLNVKWWLDVIELPNAEDIRREALCPFKEKDLEDQYGDFIQDDIDTFTKGANYIINHLKQKDNETN